eukprot:TRINITY_DN709_c0_g1_i3.p1 TRINITY_DN709_c0_g1~~TRINITY_DN709_c0_g1_i3.p1  ORF type:complete len:187 (-),score=2.28 TRINITY_DN709_c0_g1_i3:137-697(-)
MARYIFQRYWKLLETRPVLTQSVSAGLIMGAGDALEQTIERSQNGHKFDVWRTLRMTSYGLIFVGPVVGKWFRYLERIAPAHHGFRSVFKKVLIDQVVFAPLTTVGFFAAMGAMEGKRSHEIRAKLENSFVDTMIVNYYIWPAVQLINFYLVPLPMRVFFVNMVGLGYNAFLSKMNHQHHHDAHIL